MAPFRHLSCHLGAAGFVQYRLTLATTDPRRSPLVDAVTVAAQARPVGPGPRHGGPRTGP